MQFFLGIAVHLPCLAVQDDSRSFGSHYFFVDFSITHRENLLYDTLFSGVCQNTLFNCVFVRYHYKLVTHLPEHTAVPKKESLTLLFEITGFKESVQNFLVLAIRCVLAKTQLSSVFRQTPKNNDVL
jgi:hypothetical protein